MECDSGINKIAPNVHLSGVKVTIPLSGVQPGSYIIEIKDNQSLKEFHKLEIIH